MRTISVKLSDELYHQMTLVQEQHLMNLSQLIREAIQYFVSKAGVCTQEASFFDLAHDLCGVTTLPADLSINSKYMEGFGQ